MEAKLFLDRSLTQLGQWGDAIGYRFANKRARADDMNAVTRVKEALSAGWSDVVLEAKLELYGKKENLVRTVNGLLVIALITAACGIGRDQLQPDVPAGGTEGQGGQPADVVPAFAELTLDQIQPAITPWENLDLPDARITNFRGPGTNGAVEVLTTPDGDRYAFVRAELDSRYGRDENLLFVSRLGPQGETGELVLLALNEQKSNPVVDVYAGVAVDGDGMALASADVLEIYHDGEKDLWMIREIDGSLEPLTFKDQNQASLFDNLQENILNKMGELLSLGARPVLAADEPEATAAKPATPTPKPAEAPALTANPDIAKELGIPVTENAYDEAVYAKLIGERDLSIILPEGKFGPGGDNDKLDLFDGEAAPIGTFVFLQEDGDRILCILWGAQYQGETMIFPGSVGRLTPGGEFLPMAYAVQAAKDSKGNPITKPFPFKTIQDVVSYTRLPDAGVSGFWFGAVVRFAREDGWQIYNPWGVLLPTWDEAAEAILPGSYADPASGAPKFSIAEEIIDYARLHGQPIPLTLVGYKP